MTTSRPSEPRARRWPLDDGPLPGGAYVRFGQFGRDHRLHCRMRGTVRTPAFTRLWAEVFRLDDRPDAVVIDLVDAEVELSAPGAAAVVRLARALTNSGTDIVIFGAHPAIAPFVRPGDEPHLHLVEL